jgi:hypothetical protein
MVEITFRAVFCGPSDNPLVFSLVQESGGMVWFLGFDWSWPLEIRLEAATADDIPAFCLPQGGAVKVLPVQHITGRTATDAFAAMRRELERLATASQKAQGPDHGHGIVA